MNGQNIYRLKTRSTKPIYKQLNEYLDYCENMRGMSPKTLLNKLEACRMLTRETEADDIRTMTNNDINQFIRTESQRGISPVTINLRVKHVVLAAKYFRDMGNDIELKLPLVPKLKELPPHRVCYTREQIAQVLDVCTTDLEWLLIKIAFDTGMRIAELTNLTVEQINGRRINFIGKGSKAREVYISETARERLDEYLQENEIYSGRIWLSEWRYPMCSNTIRETMRKPFYDCGYYDFYPHSLRHSFGSDLQRQGADLMVIKEMMGHSDISTTQKYLHGLDGHLQDLFERYKG